MRKNILYLVNGRSGSGKDFITDRMRTLGIVKIKKATTRPRRDGETDGTYDFIGYEEFDDMSRKSMFIADSSYVVNETENEWKYAIPVSEFKPGYDYCVVVDEQMLRHIIMEDIKLPYDMKLACVLVDVDDKILLQRSLNRESANINCSEICRRFLSDKKDYDLICNLLQTYSDNDRIAYCSINNNKEVDKEQFWLSSAGEDLVVFTEQCKEQAEKE